MLEAPTVADVVTPDAATDETADDAPPVAAPDGDESAEASESAPTTDTSSDDVQSDVAEDSAQGGHVDHATVEERETVEVVDAAAALTATEATSTEPALVVTGLRKSFGSTVAVAGIDLTVPAGAFYGLVGPNGAGKTTTLSMIAGLLRPDAGTIRISGVDARQRSRAAKRLIGVLPDRLRTFDRLTGRQLLSYAGLLRGLNGSTVDTRVSDLGRAFDLTQALGRPVSDYSAGMTKKVMLAAAMIHSPRLLVLDEPFEAVDPVSSGVIIDILRTYVSHGGSVLLSSHGMDLVERVCDRVAVIVAGQVLADGSVESVRGEQTLEARFLELTGASNEVEGLEWLHTFSG